MQNEKTKTEPIILHEISEIGQARKEDLSELAVVICRTALRALGTSLIFSFLISAGRLVFGDDLTWWSLLITFGAIWLIRFSLSIEADLDEHLDGLRTEKAAVTYAPPQPEPESQMNPWRPPIPVVRRGDVALLDMNEQPRPGLPAAPTDPLLTPVSILEILRMSLENDGSFSRRTITRLRLSDGNKVTRSMWQQAAFWLHKAGVLRQDQQGGYCLPNSIRNLDDLFIALPGLGRLVELDGPDRALDRAGHGGDQGDPPGQEGSRNLAERRKAKFIELDYDVTAYLKWRDGHVD